MKKPQPIRSDILETMRALAEAVELMRPHFPEDSEDELLARAEYWRQDRYQEGRWTDFAEVAKEEEAKAAKQKDIDEAA